MIFALFMVDNSKYRFFQKFKKKYRLVLLNDGTFEERIVVKITPVFVLLSTLIIGFLTVFSVFLLFLYTPLKEYVIDDEFEKSEKNIILLSSKIDSLSMLLEKNDLYIESLKTILSGGSPTKLNEEEKIPDINKNLNLVKSEKDSLFRLFVEKKSAGDYILSSSNNTTHFFSPLVGSFTEKYNLSKNHFGVDIVSLEGSFICSIADGIVVINNWTKETGFVIGVQHSEGFLSFYKHNSKNLKIVGDYVKSGEEIAVIGSSGELSSGPHLHFELWKNGECLNPENYIVF